MKKGKNVLFVLVALLMLSPLAFANGLNLNSLGTRALAMGGAFVGLADDFSAIYWNPAGLANFKSRTFGFYGVDIIPSGTYKIVVPNSVGKYIFPGSTADVTAVDTKTKTKHYLGGMGAYIHPINEKLVAAIGFYTPSGLGSSWDGSKLAFISGGRADIEWTSKIGLLTIAPTLAYKISDKFQIGASLNINYGMFDIKMYGGNPDLTPLGIPITAYDLGQYEESDTGWGLGATFGLMFKPNDKISLGLTFRTPCKVKFSGEAKLPGFAGLGAPGSSGIDREVTWPIWIAAGLAFKPSPKFTLTFDAQWTQWSKIKKLVATYKDSTWSSLMAKTGKNEMSMLWGDQMQVRFGAEYQLTKDLALRAGYYKDGSPAPDRTMNILLPNYDFQVVTFGLGYSLGALQIDAGLEYLMGSDRDIPFLKTFYKPPIPNPAYDSFYEKAQPGLYGMKIIAPNISITYRFD